MEDEIEEFINAGGLEGQVARAKEAGDEDASMPVGPEVGVAIEVEDACEIYIDHAVKTVESQGIDFEGLHVALDTGHGASSLTSAEALRRLGAEVTVINDDFDGTDINVGCGSTHLGPLADLMKECGADVGIAHDGDADRVMLMAADGTEIDDGKLYTVAAWAGTVDESYVSSTVKAHSELGTITDLMTAYLADAGEVSPAKDGRITLNWEQDAA